MSDSIIASSAPVSASNSVTKKRTPLIFVSPVMYVLCPIRSAYAAGSTCIVVFPTRGRCRGIDIASPLAQARAAASSTSSEVFTS